MKFNINKVIVLLLISTCAASAGEGKYWIFFRDKGPALLNKENSAQAISHLSRESIERRRLQGGPLTDYSDLPVQARYLSLLREKGLTPVVTSRWLNGVSVELTGEQLSWVQNQPFVKKVQPVLRGRKKPLPEVEPPLSKELGRVDDGLDYGPSFSQNELCNIPAVHQMGVTGQGVLVAVFDTGFRLNHEAFQSLEVIDRWDFINNDGNVDLEEGQDLSSQISHGTKVLAILAGYSPGQLIGPAFGAKFLLAKTENVASETPVEEDFWIAAAEWADARGARVISSSLGYLDWYNYDDMDGETAPITIAADLAVKKGIVVVTAAGNEGDGAWKHIIAPADGDSVIAVGAVNSEGQIAAFSSVGPTADGRIKPEVVAMGLGTRTISTPPAEGIGQNYVSISGTSAATPIVAGVSALILSAFPDLTAMELRGALLATASRAGDPDNVYGYGIVNAQAALKTFGELEPPPEKHRLTGVFPNPFVMSRSDAVRFGYELSEGAAVSVAIYNVLGQKVATWSQGNRFPGRGQTVSWQGRKDTGEPLPSGIYFARLRLGTEEFVSKFTLLN